MKEFIKKCWKLVMNREMITYIIAGVLTTGVNFAASYLLYDCLHWDENPVTIVAATVAIIFAYFINKYWVFQEKNGDVATEAVKFGKFAAGRLFTLVLEWGGIFLFVTNLHVHFWIVKPILAVAVIILNYVFSKLFVFISGDKKDEK